MFGEVRVREIEKGEIQKSDLREDRAEPCIPGQIFRKIRIVLNKILLLLKLMPVALTNDNVIEQYN